MKPNKLGGFIHQLTNVAVLIGLIFVGLEIRQNNLFARSQVRTDILDVFSGLLQEGLDPFANAIITKSRAGEELAPNEIIWLETLYNIYLRNYESIYYQYRIGLVDDSEMGIFTNQLETVWACNNMFTEFYQRDKQNYQEDFSIELDQIIELSNCD